jgi:prevent-host-death family protein
MESIGVRELRQNASRYLARVKAGETLEITERGTPIAKLAPVQGMSFRDQLIASGELIPAERTDRENMPRPLPAQPGERPASEILQEQREERLY